MKYLYKLPQRKFPYEDLIKENAKRNRLENEYNIVDTGIFDDDRYFDIFIETAKEADNPDELLFRVTAYNRGPDPAPLHIVPHVFFRNTWAWGHEDLKLKPSIQKVGETTALTKHHKLGDRYFQLSPSPGVGASGEDVQPQLLFTDNDTNYKKLWKVENKTKYVKDGIHERIVNDDTDAVNPDNTGTKCAAWYAFDEGEGVAPGECAVVRFRLSTRNDGFVDEELFDDIMEQRRAEASSTTVSAPYRWRTICVTFSARPSPACCGVNSSTTSSGTSGRTETLTCLRHLQTGKQFETRSGNTCTWTTFFPCQTHGSIRSSLPGTVPSTAFHSL
jgi:hypothetical protein